MLAFIDIFETILVMVNLIGGFSKPGLIFTVIWFLAFKLIYMHKTGLLKKDNMQLLTSNNK